MATAWPRRSSRPGSARAAITLHASRVVGLEVEIGLVLGRDLDTRTARLDPASITDAVNHYFVGIEVCGSRYVDRKLAGSWGGLADSMTAYGYVAKPKDREFGADIEGFDLTLSMDGRQVFSGPAKHSFGTVSPASRPMRRTSTLSCPGSWQHRDHWLALRSRCRQALLAMWWRSSAHMSSNLNWPEQRSETHYGTVA